MAVPHVLRRVSDRTRESLFVQLAICGALLAAVLAASLVAMSSVSTERGEAARWSRNSAHVMAAVDSLVRLTTDLEVTMRAGVVTGDARFRVRQAKAARELPAAERALRDLVAADPSRRARAAALLDRVDTFVAANGDTQRAGRTLVARQGVAGFTAAGLERVRVLRATFDTFREHERALATARDAETDRATGRDRHAAVLALAGGGIALAGLLIFFALVVVGPVRRLTRAVARIEAGDRDVAVRVRGRNDVARLSRGINRLTAALGAQERAQADAAEALRASEHAARKAQQLIDAGFRHAAAGMAAMLPDGAFLRVNARLMELTGYSEPSLVEHGAHLIWTGDSGVDALRGLRDLWDGRIEHLDAERRYRHSSGRELWMAVSASCIRDEDGAPLYIFAQFVDVTARHQTEQRLRETSAALQSTQSRYEAVVDAIEEVVFQASLTGRWRFLSPAFTRLTGIPLDDAIGASALDIVHPDDHDVHAEAHGRLMLGDSSVDYEHRYAGAAGDIRWMAVEAHVTEDPETGVPIISGLMRDVTERHEAERAAREHVENLTIVSEVARALPSGDDARRAITEAATRVTGAAFTVLYEPHDGLVRPTAVSQPGAAFPAPALDDDGATVTALRTGEPVWVGEAQRSELFHPVLHGGRPVAVLAVGWDEQIEITDQQRAVIALLAAEAGVAIERADLLGRLEGMARTDTLTGLPNRRVWGEQIAAELSRARRRSEPLCVVMLDLDHFKRVNDTLGHQAGDELLAATGAAWRTTLRDVDVLARWGGEEFAVALPACDIDHALVVVERLRAAVPGPHTCSAGIALWDGEESDEALLARADAALYRAKELGRDRAEAAPAPRFASAGV